MTGIKIITVNKRAGFDFFIEETFEAGLVLKGTEIKSLRLGKASLNEAFVDIDGKGEAWIYNLSIPPYSHGGIYNHDETRKRKLLLNHHELKELQEAITRQGLTIIATKLYFKKSLAKIEIATAKGKKKHDKREAQTKKEVDLKIRRKDFT